MEAERKISDFAGALLVEQNRDPLAFYCPQPKQLRFHNMTNHKLFFIGGNGSGKTWAGAHDFALAMTGQHWVKDKYPRPPLDGRVCGELPALRGGPSSAGIIPLLHRLLRPYMADGYPQKAGKAYLSQWVLKNGSSFDIMTYDQDDQKFVAAAKDVIWNDEPFRESIYQESIVRMRRGEGGHMIFTLTFLSNAAWMDRLLENPSEDVGMVEVDTWDNCVENGGYISRKAIERMQAEMDEDQVDARIHGRRMTIKDRVFPMFTPDVHIIEPITAKEISERDIQLYVGIDPHTKRLPAWGLYGYDRNDVFYIIDEFPNYFHGDFEGKFYTQITQHRYDFPKLLKVLAEIEGRYGRVRRRFMDPRHAQSNLSNVNLTTIRELHNTAEELGLDMKFRKAPTGSDMGEGEVMSGLQLIKDRLTFDPQRRMDSLNLPTLLVSRSCANHIRMFQFIKYNRESGVILERKLHSEKLEEKYKDFCDIVRYVLKGTPKGYIRREYELNPAPYIYEPTNSLTGY